MTICILGRQPELSYAELEQLFGHDKVKEISANVAMVDLPHEEVTKRPLGGSIKIAKALQQVQTVNWDELVGYINDSITEILATVPEGKIKFGISTYGLKVNIKQQERAGLQLKKSIKASGRSVRLVPNSDLALNSAQVLHNRLTGATGVELLLVKNGASTWISQTTQVQDIESYTLRDRGRPKRDAKVGMLPPKLAQIMLNLANPKTGARVLDPFCGTGVLLQEAALMGFSVYGTDVDERMVSYTKENLMWFSDRFNMKFDSRISQADARTAKWQPPIDSVVCESYLGTAFHLPPYPDKLAAAMEECDRIIREFLTNLARQVEPGSRHCIGVPAWYVDGRFRHLPLLDELAELGYNRASFVHGNNDSLIYHRNDQIVARELLVITRK